jgi:hypothetical protein
MVIDEMSVNDSMTGELLRAIEQGHLEKFQCLTETNTLNYEFSRLILFKICRGGCTQFLKYLIKKDLVTSKQLKHPTYLHAAVSFGHLEVVEILVANGADVRDDDDNLLILASSNDYPDLVRYFIKKGCDPTAQDNSALAFACQCGSLRVVKILVHHGADIRAKDGTLVEICDELGYYYIADYFVYMGMPKKGLSKPALEYIDFMDKERVKAANKIRNWWGPLLRRINPEFVMKEAAESWNRVEKMYAERINQAL